MSNLQGAEAYHGGRLVIVIIQGSMITPTAKIRNVKCQCIVFRAQFTESRAEESHVSLCKLRDSTNRRHRLRKGSGFI